MLLTMLLAVPLPQILMKKALEEKVGRSLNVWQFHLVKFALKVRSKMFLVVLLEDFGSALGLLCFFSGNQSQVSFCSLQSVNARNAVDDDDGEYFTSIKPEPKILPSIEFIGEKNWSYSFYFKIRLNYFSDLAPVLLDLTEDDDSRISLEDTESAISDNDIRPSTKNFHGHISPVPSPVPSSEQVIISTPSSPEINAENVEVPGESPTKSKQLKNITVTKERIEDTLYFNGLLPFQYALGARKQLYCE